MKNGINNIVFVSVLLLITACVQEKISAPEEAKTARLTARMEFQPATKTVLSSLLDGMYYPLWSDGDTISVFTAEGQSPAAFALVSGAGETVGLFEGPRSGDRYVALFPHNRQTQWEGDILKFQLPEKQRYQPDSFASNAFPMIALGEAGELRFKNLCSIIRLSLTGNAVIGSITLHSDSQYLSGPASVDLDYSDSPGLVMQEGGSHDVCLECGAVLLNKEIAKDFYIVVPAATYGGLSITVDAYTDVLTKTISHEVVLKRSELRPVTSFMVEAPMIDLDNLPDNQIWYKTQSKKAFSFVPTAGQPFDAGILSNEYAGEYGIIIMDAPLREVHNSAFSASDITELYLPDCVEVIGNDALPSHLSTFRIPGCLKKLGYWNLSRVDTIYGPLVASDGRSVVKEHVLLGVCANGLEDYTTPNDVYIIGQESLAFNTFKSVHFSEGVRVLEMSALMASTVDELYMPSSIESIDVQTGTVRKGFYGSAHCTSADHLSLICPRAKDIVMLVSETDAEVFTIPEGIGRVVNAFMGWSHLKKVIVPSSLYYVSSYMMHFCPEFEGFEGPIVTPDGRGLINNGTLLYYYGEGQKNCVLPSGISSIGGVDGLGVESITVSTGTKYLFVGCFSACSNVRSIYLPTTIKEIEQSFVGLSNLGSVYLPVRVPPTVYGAPSYEPLPNLTIYVPEESYQDYLDNMGWRAGWTQYLAPYHFDNIDPPAPYVSSDYSLDGKVTVLQTASEGNGIDLVLMGRNYTDRLIADGTYLSVMEETMDAFFEPEPYHSFRHLFNVYAVNVVSSQEEGYPGILGNFLGYLDSVDQNAYLEYALKAVPDNRIDEATIAVINYADCYTGGEYGLCGWIRRPGTPDTDYGSGTGFAMYAYSTHGIHGLTWHETGGHGFGKLHDEYTHLSDGAFISDLARESLLEQQKRGECLNVDITSDPQKVRWAHFLTDPRYANERLGVYEGASLHGVYRPSENSIMNDTRGGYNAPSREAIYKRIHKLAYGADWQYDYEAFVKWDQGSKSIRPSSLRKAASKRKSYEVRDPLPVTSFNPNEWTFIRID